MQALGRLLTIVTRMRAPGTQLITKAVAVFAMTLVLSVSAMATDNPEAAVREFLRAVSSNNAAQFDALAYPRSGASVLLRTEPAAKRPVDEVESEIRALKLKQLQPFRQRGRVVTPGPHGVYPEGTTTRYMTAFEGALTVITMVKKANRWLVDVRWWLKMREMSLREEKARPDEKELVIKKFLLSLLRLNRRRVIQFLSPGADLELVFRGAPRVPEPSDQLYALAMEMPLVEAEPDEVYTLPSGKMVKTATSGNEVVMVGLYGPSEMVFELRRVKGEWRVVAESYYGIINR